MGREGSGPANRQYRTARLVLWAGCGLAVGWLWAGCGLLIGRSLTATMQRISKAAVKTDGSEVQRRSCYNRSVIPDLIQIVPKPRQAPRPDWLKVRLPSGENYFELKKLMRDLGLHTVCESARCPNIAECWHHRTATFMILGNLCTRSCSFCTVPKGKPLPLDWEEPERVADAAAAMGARYVVVTSVDRDDQPDGGAAIFARTIEALRSRIDGVQIEVLIPDFRGSDGALEIVLDAAPDVL